MEQCGSIACGMDSARSLEFENAGNSSNDRKLEEPGTGRSKENTGDTNRTMTDVTLSVNDLLALSRKASPCVAIVNANGRRLEFSFPRMCFSSAKESRQKGERYWRATDTGGGKSGVTVAENRIRP